MTVKELLAQGYERRPAPVIVDGKRINRAQPWASMHTHRMHYLAPTPTMLRNNPGRFGAQVLMSGGGACYRPKSGKRVAR